MIFFELHTNLSVAQYDREGAQEIDGEIFLTENQQNLEY